MKIAILESLGVSKARLEEEMQDLCSQGHTFVCYDRTTDRDTLRAECADADAVILANMPFPADVIRESPNLKYIDVAFTGVDHVGVDAARERQIPVSNASGYSTRAVSELAVGMMLSLLRNLPAQERAARSGGTKAGIGARELAGKTVGIVGTGKIGLHTARILSAFGCRVVGTSAKCTSGERDGIPHMPLGELLAQSDIVVLHCPLNASTRGLIGENELRSMKKSALLINVARGPVVRTEDLARALREGWIAGAGIDVFDAEPPLSASEPLLSAPNTIVTPHTAFATEESMDERLRIVFDNLRAYLAGKPVNLV